MDETARWCRSIDHKSLRPLLRNNTTVASRFTISVVAMRDILLFNDSRKDWNSADLWVDVSDQLQMGISINDLLDCLVAQLFGWEERK